MELHLGRRQKSILTRMMRMTMIITELMAMVTGLERWKTSCSQAQLSVLKRVLEQAVKQSNRPYRLWASLGMI